MAKPGLKCEDVGPLLAQAAKAEGWVLCVGAGSSFGPFPTWAGLVNSLIDKVENDQDARTALQAISQRYSAEAAIQTVQHALRLDDVKFAKALVTELYAPLQRSAGENDWRTLQKVLAAKAPGDCAQDWVPFLQIRDRLLRPSSASALAEVIVDSMESGSPPTSILSFNAEPLLYCLLNHEVVLRNKTGDPHQRFDPVTRSISTRAAGRIPYFYCHGLLPIPGAHRRVALDSSESLVFSEAQYLGLANAVFSWQSAAFLDACRGARVVFVGVSLVDPNMRRWLSWTHRNRVDELQRLETKAGDSTRHFWLEKRPASEAEQRWLESLVSHLGIRLIWLGDWCEVGPTMRRLLGIRQPTDDTRASRSHD